MKKRKLVELNGFFWTAYPEYRKESGEFQDKTYELMEKAGALSEGDEDMYLDLVRYDDYINKHLQQLKTAAESATTLDDIDPYQFAIDDLLDERLEFLTNLAFNASLVADEADEVRFDCRSRKISDIRDSFQSCVPFCKNLLDHFIHAQELKINFCVNRILTDSGQEPKGKTDSVDEKSSSANKPKSKRNSRIRK